MTRPTLIRLDEILSAAADLTPCPDCTGGLGVHVEHTGPDAGDWTAVVVHSVPCPNTATPAGTDEPFGAGPSVYDAVDVLFRQRHTLPADILRSLQDIYLCASAAQYGEPYENGWLAEDEFRADYGDHDTAKCEAEAGELRDTGESIFIGTVYDPDEVMDEQASTEGLDR